MNRDQREVIAHMGVEDVVLDDFAWTHLMQSMRGGSGPRGNRPEHSVKSYDCRQQKITAEFHDGTKVVITHAVIKKYRKTIPQHLLDTLRDLQRERRAEMNRTERWCHCPNPEDCLRRNAGDPLYGDRHHPTEEEDDEHLRLVRDLRDREKRALRAALALDEPQPGEQLELFA